MAINDSIWLHGPIDYDNYKLSMDVAIPEPIKTTGYVVITGIAIYGCDKCGFESTDWQEFERHERLHRTFLHNFYLDMRKKYFKFRNRKYIREGWL